MLTNEEHKAMIMFDRLLMAARDNETVADLLDQTLNVARMIDPRAEDKIVYGPLQRMHFEWQQMSYRMNELSKKMDNYIAQQNRSGTISIDHSHRMTGGLGTAYATSSWPSNPGFEIGHNYKPEVDWSNSIAPLTALNIDQIRKMHSSLSNLTMASSNIDTNNDELNK
jgi:hypothetical protein